MSQAQAYGLTAADIGLAGFDPDSLLEPPRKAVIAHVKANAELLPGPQR